MSLTGRHRFSECPQCHAPLARDAGDCSRCLWSSLNHDNLEESQSKVATISPLVLPQMMAPSDGHPHSMVGQNIGGYVLLEEIGHGGMGVVWRARQVAPVRDVAIKMMKGAAAHAGEFRARFELEARTLAVLDHPSILPLYGYGEDAGTAWFTMKLASGGNLAMRRKAYAGQWRQSAALIRQLAAALQYAHDRGVLHRDLKPANVLFDDKEAPYIADFGLAKLVGETSVLDGSLAVLGTPAYLAPEIAVADARAATTASDIYGLGATFYELLTGRPPYAAKSLHDMLQEITSTDPVPPARQCLLTNTGLPAVPRDLDVICMKCLARDPAKRYESARDLAEDLERWLEGRPITARKISRTERAWAWACRNPVVATLSSALLLALLTGGTLLFVKNRELRTALGSASAAREDAEKRIEFMTRDLGGKMQSFGQLTLLNEVFADVSRYYDARPANASDANAIERRITFLLKAGEVLMPQGKLDAAVVKFNEAIQQAQTAAKQHPHDARFRILQLDGHRLAGQALTENRGHLEALNVLRRGLELFPHASKPDELAARAALLTVAARSASQLASHGPGKQDPASALATEAERWAEAAVTLARQQVQERSGPAHYTNLATALEGWGVILKESAERAKSRPNPNETTEQFYSRASAAFQEMRDLCAAASKAVEDNLPWQRRVGQADNWLASILRRQRNFPAAKAHLAQQRALMQPLLSAEPLNGEWQMAMVLNAWAEGQIAEEEQDAAAAQQWHARQVEISSRLMSQNPSVRMWWIHYQQALMDVHQDLADSDPAQAMTALTRSAEAAVRANELKASPQDFKDMMFVVESSLSEMLEHAATDEAMAFADRLATRFQRVASKPEMPHPEGWLESALLMQMHLERLHRNAGNTTGADDAGAAARVIWQQVLAYPAAIKTIAETVRSHARSQVKAAISEGHAESALAAAGRWLGFTNDLRPTSQPPGWRGGWLRLIADVGEEIKAKLPDSMPLAKEFSQAWLDQLTQATPALALDAKELDAIKRIEKVLGE